MRVRDMTVVPLFALLMAAGARVVIPLPLAPFTLQLPFCLLTGLLLGPKLALWSQTLYLAVGLVGLPVFAGGGGPTYLVSPTFGYLVGFATGASLAGWLSRDIGSSPEPWRLFGVCVAALAVVYTVGVAWLWGYGYAVGAPLGLDKVLWAGALVPLPADLALCALTAMAGRRLWSLRAGFGEEGNEKA